MMKTVCSPRRSIKVKLGQVTFSFLCMGFRGTLLTSYRLKSIFKLLYRTLFT